MIPTAAVVRCRRRRVGGVAVVRVTKVIHFTHVHGEIHESLERRAAIATSEPTVTTLEYAAEQLLLLSTDEETRQFVATLEVHVGARNGF